MGALCGLSMILLALVLEGSANAKVQELNEKHVEEPPSDCDSKLIIQSDGSDFFNRPWNDFKFSFGSPNGNYWAGLEEMHRLTATGNYKLRIDVQARDSQRWYWAEYTTFHVGSEATNYRLTVAGFTGTVGYDAFGMSIGRGFTTYDRDNDIDGRNCASLVGGGFWHYTCYNFAPTANSSAHEAVFAWWMLEGWNSGYVKLSNARFQLLCKD